MTSRSRISEAPGEALRNRRPRLQGFTLIEVICVTVLIGMLIAMLLPAVSAVREASRRSQCSFRMQNLMFAVQHYELQQGRLPSGVIDTLRPVRQIPSGYHHNWICAILPYQEERPLYANVDFSVGVYAPANLPVRQTVLPILLCPSNGPLSKAGPYSSYAANHHHRAAPIDIDNSGVFFLNSRLRQDDIFDGTSNTIYLMEKPIDELDFGWMSGTYATLRNADGMAGAGGAPKRRPLPGMPDFAPPFNLVLRDDGSYPVDYQFSAPPNSGAPVIPNNAISSGYGSPHPNGGLFGYGDGRVGFVAPNSNATLAQLFHRQDGQLPINTNR